jgi:hypothetical protein
LLGCVLYDVEIERTGFPRLRFHSSIGYNLDVGGPQRLGCPDLMVPWRHQNDVVFESATALPHTVIHNIRKEAELWKAVGLFKAELALVDRWRLGE